MLDDDRHEDSAHERGVVAERSPHAVGNKDDVISIIDTKTMKVVWEQKFNFEVNQMCGRRTADFLVAARKGEDGTMEKLTFDETTGSLTSQSSISDITEDATAST